MSAAERPLAMRPSAEARGRDGDAAPSQLPRPAGLQELIRRALLRKRTTTADASAEADRTPADAIPMRDC